MFGEKEEEGEERHILGIIKKTLREALEGLLTNAEVKLFYHVLECRSFIGWKHLLIANSC